MNLLQHIAASRPQLRKSELKVADHVLAHAADVMHSSMADLAREVGISEPTIVRFCRDTTLATLMDVRERLDPVRLERAIEALSNARRVEFYGFGASGAVASDAQHKFFRLQVSTAAYSDPHMQAMSAVTLGPQDVAVTISQTGRTKDLLHSAALVGETGATLISLCPSQTPLADLAHIHIPIDVTEDTDIYTPLSSRIAHLVVIDVLAMGMAMRRGPALVNHLTHKAGPRTPDATE